MRRASILLVSAFLIGCTTTEVCMDTTSATGSAFTGLATSAAAAPAAEAGGGGAARQSPGPWSVGGAIGFTVDPSGFLTAFEADYAVTDNLLVGPLFQFGASDEEEILAPSLNVQYMIDLDEPTGPLARLKPFAQMGMGFAYIEKERPGRTDKDDLGFLMNVGFGLQYDVSDRFAVGNHVLFNVMPDEVIDERFFFSWHFLTGTIRF